MTFAASQDRAGFETSRVTSIARAITTDLLLTLAAADDCVACISRSCQSPTELGMALMVGGNEGSLGL